MVGGYTLAMDDGDGGGKGWLRSPWAFLWLGFRDFWINLRHTWPIIVAFIAYLLASASVLYSASGVSTNTETRRRRFLVADR